MNLFQIIYLIEIVIWFLPPIRQYKNNYFYFFLILAITEIFAFITYKIFELPTIITYAIFSYFLSLSLIDKKTLKKHLIIFILLFFALLSIIIYNPSTNKAALLSLYLIIAFLLIKK